MECFKAFDPAVLRRATYALQHRLFHSNSRSQHWNFSIWSLFVKCAGWHDATRGCSWSSRSRTGHLRKGLLGGSAIGLLVSAYCRYKLEYLPETLKLCGYRTKLGTSWVPNCFSYILTYLECKPNRLTHCLCSHLSKQFKISHSVQLSLNGNGHNVKYCRCKDVVHLHGDRIFRDICFRSGILVYVFYEMGARNDLL